ncbi:MAG: FAD-dependent oxidoreductase, partial [Actinomycetes bacterium]
LEGLPPTEPGRAAPFSVGSSAGDVAADIWFRAFGTTPHVGYLGDELAAARTPGGRIRVTGSLNVAAGGRTHAHVYGIGDITDVPEPKMAATAMQHADVVARNILAQVRGEAPSATHEPSPVPFLLLPLGTTGGVGQLPSPDGPVVVAAQAVSEAKGTDLFTGRFAEMFGVPLPVAA